MANDDSALAGVDLGSDPQAALTGALGGGGAQPSAPAAAPSGAGPGGGYDPLSGIQQLMGALNQTPQVPAAANVQQRHGGVLTGLAGVLLDGLASGLAPTAQQAFERPMQRQQQQMQMQEMQMRQQQAQQEMAMAPIKMKAQMAQSAINILQAGHMLRDLSKEHQIDMLGAQANYTKAAIDEGRARLDATAPTLDAAQKRTQELQAQNKDTALNYGYYPTKWDKDGNATEYGVYEAYPHGALQKDFDYDFEGDKELGITAEHVHLPAGMQESEARLKLSAVANEHSAAMKIASDRMLAQKMQQQMAKESFTENERLKADARAERMIQLQTQRMDLPGQREALTQINKPRQDFNNAMMSVATLREMLKGGMTGNQVENALSQLSTALMTVSAENIRRINMAEVGMAGPQAESLQRSIEGYLNKKISGQIPEGYRKDVEQLADAYERQQVRKYTNNVNQINRQFARSMPGFVPIVSGLDPEQEAMAAGGGGGAGGAGGGVVYDKAGNAYVKNAQGQYVNQQTGEPYKAPKTQ